MISITIDVTKIDKNKIKDRTFTNKEGHSVTCKDYKMVVVPVKEPKVLKEGDTWVMTKTHFVAEEQSPEEKNQKAPTKYIGEGITFTKKEIVNIPAVEYPNEDSVNPIDSSMPF